MPYRFVAFRLGMGPRDRNSTFEPTLIGKHEKQLKGFDDRIISLYSRGLSTRDIQAHFKEVYWVDVSAGFISQVTNAVMDDVKRWQQRPLDAFYPIVYLDCIVVKSQDGGAVTNKSVYLALGINGQGEKELLGLWIAKTEGAKFWLSVMTELKNRGLQDIFIACFNGIRCGTRCATSAGKSVKPLLLTSVLSIVPQR